jgi:flagellum-specific peptidoglycan hydrolase FlgJ
VLDYEGWAKGLKEAGYATNPKYAEMLVKIIRDNGLDRYDTLVYRGQPMVVLEDNG